MIPVAGWSSVKRKVVPTGSLRFLFAVIVATALPRTQREADCMILPITGAWGFCATGVVTVSDKDMVALEP